MRRCARKVCMSLMSDPIRTVATYGAHGVIDASGYQANEAVPQLKHAADKVGEILAEFGVEAERIRDNPDYTQQGKQSQLAQLAMTYLSRFPNLEVVLEGKRTLLQEMRAAATITLGEADQTARAVRAAEIRALLPKGDALAVRVIFDEAIITGDQDTFDAIRLAPRFLKLLPSADIADGEARWQEKRSPAQAKRLRDLQRAVDVLARVIADGKSIIQGEAGIQPLDAVEKMARGEE